MFNAPSVFLNQSHADFKRVEIFDPFYITPNPAHLLHHFDLLTHKASFSAYLSHDTLTVLLFNIEETTMISLYEYEQYNAIHQQFLTGLFSMLELVRQQTQEACLECPEQEQNQSILADTLETLKANKGSDAIECLHFVECESPLFSQLKQLWNQDKRIFEKDVTPILYAHRQDPYFKYLPLYLHEIPDYEHLSRLDPYSYHYEKKLYAYINERGTDFLLRYEMYCWHSRPDSPRFDLVSISSSSTESSFSIPDGDNALIFSKDPPGTQTKRDALRRAFSEPNFEKPEWLSEEEPPIQDLCEGINRMRLSKVV